MKLLKIMPDRKNLHHSIILSLDDKNVLNKKYKLMNKCRHPNKLLLINVKRNDTMD